MEKATGRYMIPQALESQLTCVSERLNVAAAVEEIPKKDQIRVTMLIARRLWHGEQRDVLSFAMAPNHGDDMPQARLRRNCREGRFASTHYSDQMKMKEDIPDLEHLEIGACTTCTRQGVRRIPRPDHFRTP
jgi:hypothetical protein